MPAQNKESMKIHRIITSDFRHLKNVNIEFGDYITVISGLNGTGKSSVLGLIGQLFDYKGKEKTINNNKFATIYSEIFKFCHIHDQKKAYEYIAEILDGDNLIERKVKSRYVKKEKRFRMDIGARARAKGAIDLPVIYLGLRRLFPLAQEPEGSISIKKHNLDPSEIKFYEDQARSIFVMLSDKVKPQDVKAPNKEFLAMETNMYSNLGNSAGQDNIGQVITAILSFRRLSQGNNYKGGILLLDELETTLFPGAQINLIKKLYSYTRALKLQIIFTTHSLEIIKFLQNNPLWDTKINFLELRDGEVQNKTNPSFEYIKSRILIETKQKEAVEKKVLLCEDDLARLWTNNLISGHENKKWCEAQGRNISDGTIKILAESQLKCFKEFTFIIDGDGSQNSSFKKQNNIIFLPDKERPETVFYKYLKNLAEADAFWGGDNHFYKDTCFNNFTDARTKAQYKNWFNAKRCNFGRGCSRLFNKWKRDNQDLVADFNAKITKALNST